MKIIVKYIIIMLILLLFLFQNINAQETTQTIILKEGFNFVSFTVVPQINAQQLLLQYLPIDDIYYYNAAAGSFLSCKEGGLSSLGSGKGYIIKSKAQIDITLAGEPVLSAVDISLKPGFNLVGFSQICGKTKFKNFVEKSNKIKGIYKWNSASGSFIQVLRNSTSSTVELIDGVDPEISAGFSYFINVAQEATMSFEQEQIKIDGMVTQNDIQSISLSKSFDNINTGIKYDLSKIIINANYLNGNTKSVSGTNWSVNSGNGTIENNQYFSSLETGAVILKASYTENNITLHTDFNLSVIAPPQVISMKSAILNQSGGEMKLNDQVSYAVMPGTLNESTEITIAEVKYFDDFYNGKTVIRVESNSNITLSKLLINVEPQIKSDNIGVFVYNEDGITVFKGNIENGKYAININGTESPALKAPNLRSFFGCSNSKEYIIEKFEPRKFPTDERIQTIINKPSSQLIKAPFYSQYNSYSCWAACILMLCKAYNNFMPADFNSIYKIYSWCNISKKIGYKYYTNSGEHEQLIFTSKNISNDDLLDKIGSITKCKLEKKFFKNRYAFAEYTVKKLSQGIPVLLLVYPSNEAKTGAHANLLLKYTCNEKVTDSTKLEDIYDKIEFLTHDPSGCNPYGTKTLKMLYDTEHNREYFLVFSAVNKPCPLNFNVPVLTTHLPDCLIDDENNISTDPAGVYFSNKGTNKFAFSWAPETEIGYKIMSLFENNSTCKDYEIGEFNQIYINNMYVFDAAKISDQFKMEISVNESIMPIKIKKIEFIKINNNIFNYDETWNQYHNLDSGKFYIDMDEFKSKIKLNDGIDFKLSVKLLYQSILNSSSLDGFDVKFKYRKLFIIPDSSINTNELKAPSTLNFTAKLVDNTVIQPDQLQWSVESTDGKISVTNGAVNIATGASGKYLIKAIVKDTVAIHAGKEAIYEINVNGGSEEQLEFKIVPEKTIVQIEEGKTAVTVFSAKSINKITKEEKILTTDLKWEVEPADDSSSIDSNGNFSCKKPGTYKIKCKWTMPLRAPEANLAGVSRQVAETKEYEAYAEFVGWSCIITAQSTTVLPGRWLDVGCEFKPAGFLPLSIKWLPADDDVNLTRWMKAGSDPMRASYIFPDIAGKESFDIKCEYGFSNDRVSYKSIKTINVKRPKIIPEAPFIHVGDIVKFSYELPQGITNIPAFTWVCANGQVDNNGNFVFTAPEKPGKYEIKLTWPGQNEDQQLTFATQVNINVFKMNINPGISTVKPGSQIKFTPAAEFQPDDDELFITGWTALYGSVLSDGSYTAPGKVCTDKITCEYTYKGVKHTCNATVNVNALKVSVIPKKVSLHSGEKITINAMVDGANTNANVDFTVDGGSLSAGSGKSTIFTAPVYEERFYPQNIAFTLTATSQEDRAQSAKCRIIVALPVRKDFVKYYDDTTIPEIEYESTVIKNLEDPVPSSDNEAITTIHNQPEEIHYKYDGYYIYYDKQHNVLTKGYYVRGLKNGIFEEYQYLSDGRKRTTIDCYVDGLLDGTHEVWMNNMQTFSCQYSNGKLNGAYIQYDEQGRIIIKCNYADDKKDGIWEEYQYFTDGSLNIYVLKTYKADVQSGKFERKMWYSNGQLFVHEKGNYANDCKNGSWETRNWFLSGKEGYIETGGYLNDKMDGQWEFTGYDENGNTIKHTIARWSNGVQIDPPAMKAKMRKKVKKSTRG